MIVWSRWGILVLVAVGLGVGTGFGLNAVLDHNAQTGPGAALFAGVGLVAAGIYSYLLEHHVLAPHLDKPRQHFVVQPLAQPITHPNGYRQTHQQVPVVDPQTGRPIWFRPRSSLFFIPTAVWPYLLAGIGLVLTVVNAIRLALG